VLGGPPENCSPDGSECEIVELKLLQVWDDEGEEVTVHPDAAGRLLAALDQALIEEGSWERFHEMRESFDEDDGYAD
jgi:hypothetical protein